MKYDQYYNLQYINRIDSKNIIKMDYSLVVERVILSAIAIGSTLAFFSVVDEQIVGCTSNSTYLSTFCFFSLNSWNINQEGHDLLVAEEPDSIFVLDVLKIAPLIHLCVTFIGWILYVVNFKITAAFTIALAHINGWIVIASVTIHKEQFHKVASLLTSTLSAQHFTTHMSIGVMASVAASSLQLVTVLAILLKVYWDKN